MQLTFLGNYYKAKLSQIPVDEGKVGGKYRGQIWKIKSLQKVLISKEIYHLKYRGVKY